MKAQDKQVKLEEIMEPGTGIIRLKIRQKAKSSQFDALITGGGEETSKGSRRTKERKIGEVILAVMKWRKLYVGEP